MPDAYRIDNDDVHTIFSEHSPPSYPAHPALHQTNLTFPVLKVVCLVASDRTSVLDSSPLGLVIRPTLREANHHTPD